VNENLRNNGVLGLGMKMRVKIGRVIGRFLNHIVCKGVSEKLICGGLKRIFM